MFNIKDYIEDSSFKINIKNNRIYIDNYISIGRNFIAEKNYLKALKFFKKAYNCPEGKNDIDKNNLT